MENKTQGQKVIVDLLLLNELNAGGCPACGGRFTLGETVVSACGAWGDGPQYIHEAEAIFDAGTNCYYERSHYHSDIKKQTQAF
jgi:hypothetical protein